VLPLWRRLEPHWGRARAVRAAQPLMALAGPPAVPPDPQVRQVRPDELEVLLPACVAMFTEEIGVSPTAGDGGALYRHAGQELIAQGRAVRTDRGRPGAVQGRGRVPPPGGLPGAGRLGGARAARPGAVGRRHGRRWSSWPAGTSRRWSASTSTTSTPAARRAYRRVGFDEVGLFTSVLF
jgi:hypothetical protein